MAAYHKVAVHSLTVAHRLVGNKHLIEHPLVVVHSIGDWGLDHHILAHHTHVHRSAGQGLIVHMEVAGHTLVLEAGHNGNLKMEELGQEHLVVGHQLVGLLDHSSHSYLAEQNHQAFVPSQSQSCFLVEAVGNNHHMAGMDIAGFAMGTYLSVGSHSHHPSVIGVEHEGPIDLR